MVALADRTRNIFLVDRVTGRLRALRGNPRHFGNPEMVFSPDGRCLASRVGGITPRDLDKIVVNLWDVASGEEVGGMPVAFGVCHSVLFSPDGQTLITVESTATSREAPVRSWRISDERKCFVLGESLRPDQLANKLAPARRSANPGSRPFQLTDVLAVTPAPNSFTAVWRNDQKSSSTRPIARLSPPSVESTATRSSSCPAGITRLRTPSLIWRRSGARPVPSRDALVFD